MNKELLQEIKEQAVYIAELEKQTRRNKRFIKSLEEYQSDLEKDQRKQTEHINSLKALLGNYGTVKGDTFRPKDVKGQLPKNPIKLEGIEYK